MLAAYYNEREMTMMNQDTGTTAAETIDASKNTTDTKTHQTENNVSADQHAEAANTACSEPNQGQQQQLNQLRVPPNKEKYKILLVAVGSAPMLKKSKFLLSGKEPFRTLQSRLKKMLKVRSSNGESSSDLFLYVNQSFIPSPDDLIGDLGDLFSVGEELQIHYSLQEAFL